jgi:hypothetical protein
MLKSAGEEIIQWAERCRYWSRKAATKEQRSTLLGLERLLIEAAADAEDVWELGRTAAPLRPTKLG